MLEGRKIKVGDTVSVSFHGAKHTLCRKATVLRIPTATGDYWVFEEVVTWTLHYVSEGCTVTKELK